MNAALPTVGDVVAVNRDGRLTAGTVAEVVVVGGDAVVAVDTLPGGLLDCDPDEVTVAPAPAAGQQWRCLTDPCLVLVVESAVGQVADCRRLDGRWVGDVVLPGWYELVGGAS
ncbi:hypothetical protein ABT336_12110 [Micromonospora sp. NPDC000207]|uniref:hypothetical protein n=1 Tax=Micromonospora sp. NPDC000207 TaxID=3154246 RepID=UPI00333432B3